nr:rhodanese-like domain-containing protein [Oceaniglobus trochenteri]
MTGLGACAVAGLGFVALDGQNLFYSALTEDFGGDTLTPPQAHDMAMANSIVLIDIRRPDEWARTGSAGPALRLDLRREDFIAALDGAVDGNRDAPVALICARGVRSARLANHLRAAGFTRIIDVPEGMLGSSAGPGWIARGLPVR